MKTLLAVAALASAVSPIFAAQAADPLSQAADQAQAYKMPECEPNKALDSLKLSVSIDDGSKAAKALAFKYESCQRADRDDLEPAYETRTYVSGDYAVILVTYLDGGAYHQHSTTTSEVLLAKGTSWIARFGDVANAALASASLSLKAPLEGGKGGSAALSSARGCAPSPALDGTIGVSLTAVSFRTLLLHGDFSPVSCEPDGASERRVYRGPGEDTLVVESGDWGVRVTLPFRTASAEFAVSSIQKGAVASARAQVYERRDAQSGAAPAEYTLTLRFAR